MKNNEKVIVYMQDFQIENKKSPYPAYAILKPYLSYIRSIWELIRPVKGSIRPFLGFSDLRYHLKIKGV
tara:strand:+ start:184 stop:390 length:207 start_codon:yes stop_codon:yes gene_type:complete